MLLRCCTLSLGPQIMYRHSRSLKNKLVLMRMYPLLQFLQCLRCFALHFPNNNRLSTINLADHVVDHYPSRVVRELAFMVVVVCSFYCVYAIICKQSVSVSEG